MILIKCIKNPNEINKDLFDNLCLKISPKKQNKLLKYHFQKDVYRGLIGEILARTMLCEFLGVKNRDIEFYYNEYGKPLVKVFDKCFFNISHSGDWIVCAIDSKPIGIDIEEIRDIDFAVAKQVFSKKEYITFSSKTENKKLAYFYSLWTLKESYIKAIGYGFSRDSASFSIMCDEKKMRLEDDWEPENDKKFNFKQYEIDDSYKFSVCCKDGKFSKESPVISFDELCAKVRLFI